MADVEREERRTADHRAAMLDPHGAPGVRMYDGVTDLLLDILLELRELNERLEQRDSAGA